MGFALRAVPLSFLAETKTEAFSDACAMTATAGRQARIAAWRLNDVSVIRRLRNHPHGDRSPDAVARLALIRDEVSVIVVQNFVAERFDPVGH